MTPAERIRAGVFASGKAQAEIARIAGLSPQNFQRIIDGSVSRSKHLTAIGEAIGASVEWILNGTGPAPSWWKGEVASPSTEEKLVRAEMLIDLLVKEISALRGETAELRSQLEVAEQAAAKARQR